MCATQSAVDIVLHSCRQWLAGKAPCADVWTTLDEQTQQATLLYARFHGVSALFTYQNALHQADDSCARIFNQALQRNTLHQLEAEAASRHWCSVLCEAEVPVVVLKGSVLAQR